MANVFDGIPINVSHSVSTAWKSHKCQKGLLGRTPLMQGGRYLPRLPRMGYLTHAVRIVLGTSTIRSTLYKLKLQFCRISRDSGRKHRRLATRETAAIPAFLPRHFSARTRYTFNAFPRKEEEKSRKNLSSLPSSLQKERRATKVERALRADVSLSGECARICAEAAFPKPSTGRNYTQ